jgi:hypothetical protein
VESNPMVSEHPDQSLELRFAYFHRQNLDFW